MLAADIADHPQAVEHGNQILRVANGVAQRVGSVIGRDGLRCREAVQGDENRARQDPEAKFLHRAVRRGRLGLDDPDTASQMSRCLEECRFFGSSLAGHQPERNRVIELPCFGKVMRDQYRACLAGPQDRRDIGMDILSPGLQQAVIGGILNQGVLARVGRLRAAAAAKDQFAGDQLLKGSFQAGARRNLRQQLECEVAADAGGDLRNLLDSAETVETRRQAVLQGSRDRQRRQRAFQDIAIVFLSQKARLQHRLRQFLDKQWHAIRFGDDLVEHLFRQRLAAGHPGHHVRALAAAQSVQGMQGDMSAGGPWHGKLRPTGYDQQHGGVLNAVDNPIQGLERAGIDPVDIFEDHQHRAGCRQCHCQIGECRNEILFLLLRARWQRGIAIGRQRQHGGEQGQWRRHAARGLPQQVFQLVEPGFGAVIAFESRGACQLIENRVESGIRMVGRALIAQANMRLLADPLAQGLGNARLADAGLPRYHDDLSIAVLGLLPALQQEADLLVAPDKRGQADLMRRLETGLHGALSHHAIERDRCREAFQGMGIEIFQGECSGNQPARALCHDHRVRFGQGLHASGNIWRLADRQAGV